MICIAWQEIVPNQPQTLTRIEQSADGCPRLILSSCRLQTRSPRNGQVKLKDSSTTKAVSPWHLRRRRYEGFVRSDTKQVRSRDKWDRGYERNGFESSNSSSFFFFFWRDMQDRQNGSVAESASEEWQNEGFGTDSD